VESCSHLEQVNLKAKARTKGCEECEKIGDKWVALRLCLSCGHVGPAAILLKINMGPIILKQLIILSLSRLNPVKIGNGAT
jgi:hypothetical protein